MDIQISGLQLGDRDSHSGVWDVSVIIQDACYRQEIS